MSFNPSQHWQDEYKGVKPGVQIDTNKLAVRTFVFCAAAGLLFVFLDAVVNHNRLTDIGAIRRLFNIAREDSLSSWFMVSQTFVAGIVLGLITLVERDKGASRPRVIGWALLTGFFIYLSADDGAEIHERLGTSFEIWAEEGALSDLAYAFPSYGWQVAVLPFLAGAGVLMVFFLWRELPGRGARYGVICAAGIMALAVGIDFIEGLEKRHPWNLHTWISEHWDVRASTVRHFSKALEEFLEMLAIAALLAIFISRLGQALAPQWTVAVKGADERVHPDSGGERKE
jgi:hypothetical protein